MPTNTTPRSESQTIERVADQARSAVEHARSRITGQVNAVARAVESAAQALQEQNEHRLSQKVQPYVRKIEEAADYLQTKSPRELKEDMDDFARRRPAWFLGGAVVLGLLATRFLKSSEKGSVAYARA